MASTGLSVVIEKDAISGIYPDLLRQLSEKESCDFQLTAVPRARLESLFRAGQADLMIPATRTPNRDEVGIFVPLIANRAMLISLAGEHPSPAIHNLQELIDRHELKVALVRGFDYGDGYQVLVRELQKQGRLILEADPVSVARTLKAGGADYTVMAPTILAGSIQADPRISDLGARLRYDVIPELPWGESGVYISKSSLSAKDTAALHEILTRAAKSGAVWKAFQQYYAPEVLKESIRGLKG
jgi:polar amino acid transport system substrate-binding protein